MERPRDALDQARPRPGANPTVSLSNNSPRTERNIACSSSCAVLNSCHVREAETHTHCTDSMLRADAIFMSPSGSCQPAFYWFCATAERRASCGRKRLHFTAMRILPYAAILGPRIQEENSRHGCARCSYSFKWFGGPYSRQKIAGSPIGPIGYTHDS